MSWVRYPSRNSDAARHGPSAGSGDQPRCGKTVRPVKQSVRQGTVGNEPA